MKDRDLAIVALAFEVADSPETRKRVLLSGIKSGLISKSQARRIAVVKGFAIPELESQ
jgi:hypothetical protein